MRGNLARTGVCAAISVGVIAAICLSPAPSADAASAVADVPCSTAALSQDMGNVIGGDKLRLAPGCSYRLTAALPAVTVPLVIAGNGATLEPASGSGTPALTLLRVTGDGALTVSKLNIRGGDAGISVSDEGQLTVNGGTFTGNTGAIDSTSPLYSPQVNGVSFIHNTTAINNYSAFSSVVVNHSTFTDNVGGAIWEWGIGGSVTNSTFLGNIAQNGGALYLNEGSNEYVASDAFLDNIAIGDGGAIYNDGDNGMGVTIGNSKLDDNHAYDEGGGLYALGPSLSDITGTDIEQNSAPSGGGFESAGDTILVGDSTISGNQASLAGGGIGNESAYAGLSLTDSTISRNITGTYGGGVLNQGEVDSTGGRISDNRASNGGGGIYNKGAATSVTLTGTSVLDNSPDNCEPADSVTGCTGTADFQPAGARPAGCAYTLRASAAGQLALTGPGTPGMPGRKSLVARVDRLRVDRLRGSPRPGSLAVSYCLTDRLARLIAGSAQGGPGAAHTGRRSFSPRFGSVNGLGGLLTRGLSACRRHPADLLACLDHQRVRLGRSTGVFDERRGP
jgi:polymorphic membrane protein